MKRRCAAWKPLRLGSLFGNAITPMGASELSAKSLMKNNFELFGINRIHDYIKILCY